MKRLALLFNMLALVLPISGFAQAEAGFFGLDTLNGKRSLVLPLIYFQEGSSFVDDRAKEDLSYIAFMMHLHKDANIRIRTQALYKRFERKPRRLNKKRMKKIKRVLKKDYQISRKRIITIHHQPWQFRSAEDPRPSKLLQRRVVCDVVWNE
ncbi:MAG: hypothetical protein MRZ79_14560 [Bacteroidia bacterium]|nr:hypothetical protein [Bacteroidia bacterium]